MTAVAWFSLRPDAMFRRTGFLPLLALATSCTPLVGATRPGDAAADAPAPDASPPEASCPAPAGVRSGSRDPAFRGGAFPVTAGSGFLVRGALLDRRGRVYLYGAGDCDAGVVTDDFAVVRHLADGTPDAAFGDGGWLCFDGPAPGDPSDQFLGGAVDAAGRVYLVGQSGRAGDTAAVVARLGDDGRLDPTFNRGRVVGFRPVLPPDVRTAGEWAAFGLVAGADGLVVAGTDWTAVAFLARLDPDGAVDAAFAAAPGAVDPGVRGWYAIQRAGAGFVLAGTRVGDNALVVRRVGADGARVATFGVAGDAVALAGEYAVPRGLAVLRDGAIVVAAATGHADVNHSIATVARFTPDGVLDDGFGAGGVYRSAHNLNYHYDFATLAAQCDGRVLVTAHYRSAAGSFGYAERLDTRGRLDRAWSPAIGGILGDERTHGPAAVLVDPAGWVYLATRSGYNTEYALHRYAP